MHPRRTPRLLPALLLPFAAAACDDAPGFSRSNEADDGRPLDEDTRFAVLTEDGRVKLGLTDDQVYVRLSDETLDEVDAELADDMDDEGLGAVIASAVKGAVGEALRFRVTYDVDAIRDIRWEDDRLVVELEDGGTAFADTDIDGNEFSEAFTEKDARAFAAAFREVKDGR